MSLVYVMLSGGVDSSTALLDIINSGHEVRAIYMNCWDDSSMARLGVDSSEYVCTTVEDMQDARHVANTLGVEFEVWDLREEYFEHVMKYMLDAYSVGLTPNPDVFCNSFIKFGVFFNKAMTLGADYVASGHYARTSAISFENNIYPVISAAKYLPKDQSYFLSRINKDIIGKIIFPIGEYVSKEIVRAKAEQYNLITANKSDSQGICFVGRAPIAKLLKDTLGIKQGNIIDKDNNILGIHNGAYLYTIGQRGGLGLAGGPWYVTSINIVNNTVIVTHETEKRALETNNIVASNTILYVPQNYFSDEKTYDIQIRYHGELKKGKINFYEDRINITLEEPHTSIARGQIVVISEQGNILTAGIIE
jgi:tRNA-uridine 2-sulfurtransferase